MLSILPLKEIHPYDLKDSNTVIRVVCAHLEYQGRVKSPAFPDNIDIANIKIRNFTFA